MYNFEKKVFFKNKIKILKCPTLQKGDYFISQSVTLLTHKLKKCVAHFSNISNETVKKRYSAKSAHFLIFFEISSICRITQNISPTHLFFNVFFSSNHSAHQTKNKVMDMSTVACLRQFTLFTNTQLVGWCK